jgi:hypothetical protein
MAEEYRERAAECERDAARIGFQPDKKVLLEIAQRWREMADKAEARDARKRQR